MNNPRYYQRELLIFRVNITAKCYWLRVAASTQTHSPSANARGLSKRVNYNGICMYMHEQEWT